MSKETTSLTLPDEQQFRHDIQAINRFQQVVHANMVEGQDYGVIPGTQKPTLLKPGAEKIAKLLGLADQYEILERQEDWDKPFFHYLVSCKLVSVASGVLISEGLGECNSLESKYRWRESKRVCPKCGAEAIIKGKAEYGGGWLCFKKTGGCGAKWTDGAPEIEDQKIERIENEDIYSQVNTILKMGKKRALVDAALSAGRLSNVFTQDIEDWPNGIEEGENDKAPRAGKPTVVSTGDKTENPEDQAFLNVYNKIELKPIDVAQLATLKMLKARFKLDFNPMIEKHHWTAKCGKELSYDQAARLIQEILDEHPEEVNNGE